MQPQKKLTEHHFHLSYVLSTSNVERQSIFIKSIANVGTTTKITASLPPKLPCICPPLLPPETSINIPELDYKDLQ